MLKVSDVISKPVYTVYEGVLVGTVVSFIYDNTRKKIKGFFVFDDESDSEHYILSKNIYKLGEESILIRNRSKIQISKFEKRSILNMRIVSIDGAWKGKVCDVFFDDKFDVSAIDTKEKVLVPANSIVNIGEDIVVFDNGEKKVNIARMKPAARILVENLPNIKVSILEERELSTLPIISNNFEEKNFIAETRIIGGRADIPPVKKNLVLPAKVLSNPKSIIGKNAKERIIGLNGEVIVKQGQLITEKVYEKAKRHSKIFELTNNILN